MDDAKGIRHSADCERNQFIKELKILKQRASQLRCQIGEMVLVSERMEKGEKRCSRLQRRLESCDTRVGELEEELSTRTQEVELARQTYRLLRKDLEQFNKNLTSADESTSTRMDGGRKDGKGGRGGGSRRRKREDAPSQQLETVKTKRRKKSDNKQEEEKDREEEEQRISKVTGQTESSAGQFGGEEEQGGGKTAQEGGKEEGGGGKEVGGGGKKEGGGGKEEGGREGCEADAEQEMNRSPRNSSSYVISNDCSSTKFKSSVEMTQPLQLPPAVTSVSKKTSCLPSIRISEVHPRGNYIRIINASQSQEGDLGNHFLLQRYQDAPFTVFRFPASVRLPPLGVATVWSASGAAEESSAGRQLPTADFIFTSQPIWASGPDCITILCRPNEQALKWLSSGPASLSKRSADQPRFRPSSQTTKKTKRQNPDKKSSSTRNPRGREEEEETSTPVKVDPVKKSQTKAASGWKDERGRDGKRLEDSRQTTSDSSPDGRTFVQRKKGVALIASATDESDLERRRRTVEARKRKKREEKASTKQEEECLACEEEIRVNRIRREKEDTSGKKQGDEEEKEEEEDCWKRGAAIIMNKTIPCTFVHIIDEASTSSTGRKDSDGGGRGEGGGGGCVSERSECGESRDCDDTTRSPTNSKCCNATVSESNIADDDCGDCSESSPQRKRLGHASLNRCGVESREGSMMGRSTSRKNDCKERKETWNGSQGRRRVERRGCEEEEESFQGRKTAGCCPSEEQEEDEEEDDCSPRRRKEKTVSPLRKSNCDECYDVTRKKEQEECVQKKRHRSMGCGGRGVRGGGVRGGGAEGGCGGGAKRRTKERKECDDDCCEKEEGSWSKWKKWLAGMVVGGGGGSGGRKEGGYCEDQPCFSPAPSTAPAPVKCGDRGKSVVDTEVRCIDQVQVRERCPTYRPRLEKGALCRCPDGCPACPPKRADCSEEVDLIERRRPTKKKQELEKKECKCAEKHKGDAAARSSSSSRCLRETTSATCHLDSMALTAASVMAAGLTVAAIYCH